MNLKKKNKNKPEISELRAVQWNFFIKNEERRIKTYLFVCKNEEKWEEGGGEGEAVTIEKDFELSCKQVVVM